MLYINDIRSESYSLKFFVFLHLIVLIGPKIEAY